MDKLESFKHERILAEGLQEDGQIQVEEAEAGDKVGQTHWGKRQNKGGVTDTLQEFIQTLCGCRVHHYRKTSGLKHSTLLCLK